MWEVDFAAVYPDVNHPDLITRFTIEVVQDRGRFVYTKCVFNVDLLVIPQMYGYTLNLMVKHISNELEAPRSKYTR